MRLGPIHIIKDSTWKKVTKRVVAHAQSAAPQPAPSTPVPVPAPTPAPAPALPPHSVMNPRAIPRASVLPVTFVPPDRLDARSKSAVNRCIAAFKKTEQVSVPAAPSLWDFIEHNLFNSLIDSLRKENVQEVFDFLSQMFLSPLTCGVAKKWTHDLEEIRTATAPCAYQIRLTDSIVNLALAVGAVPRTCIEQQGPTAEEGSLAADLESLVDSIERRTGLSLAHPRVGGCFGYSIGNRIVNSDSLHHTYPVHRLGQLGAEPTNRIVEIGGGYGCLASMFVRAGYRNYQIYDLPYVNVLQGYYLIMAFPDLKIRLFGESEGDIAVLPHWAFKDLPAKSVDYFLNTDSMPEMGRAAAVDYIAGIARAGRGVFLSINQEAASVPGIGGAPTQPQNRVREVVESHGGFKCLARSPWWMREGYVEEIFRPV